MIARRYCILIRHHTAGILIVAYSLAHLEAVGGVEFNIFPFVAQPHGYREDDVAEFAAYVLVVSYSVLFPKKQRRLTVAYVHGFDACPLAVSLCANQETNVCTHVESQAGMLLKYIFSCTGMLM